MSSGYKLGIDLGGTKIFAVLARSGDREIVGRAKLDTPVKAGVEGIVRAIHAVGTGVAKDAGVAWADVASVGVAVPGAVNHRKGVVQHAPALGWHNEPIQAMLAHKFGRAVHLDNDVNCGVLAEAVAGAAQGAAIVVGFFVGTGLGGGIVVNGTVFRGMTGGAGEFGHMIVKQHGRKCGCGHRGCLEAYCSKTAFGRRFEKLINRQGMKSMLPAMMGGGDFRNVRSKLLSKAYRKDDPVVCSVLNRGATMLGVGVANIMALLAPDCVVLGGGVMEALGAELLPLVRRGAERHLFGMEPSEMRIVLAALQDDAVALGAAMLGE